MAAQKGGPHKHQPTKGGRLSPRTPLPTSLHHLWGLPPTMGGPPNKLPRIMGCPPKGAHPKTAPHEKGDLVPLAGTWCFLRVFSPKKFWKVPEHFRHPPKILDVFQNFSGLMVYSKTIFSFSETLPVFSPKHFQCLQNFFGDFLSDSFPSTQHIDEP